MATVTLHGTEIHTNGELPRVGVQAPEFHLVDKDLKDVSLKDYTGKKVLSVVPSLDTPVCATSARRFNQEAASLSQVQVLVISADLPFAMGRFCQAEGLSRVIPLSMMRSRQFAEDYGVLIVDGALRGISARALLVLDESNRVIFSQLVPEIGDEPDYAEALKALA